MSDGDARPEILLFVVDAGAGHRSAANALLAAAEASGSPLRFRVVSLETVFARLDLFRQVTGRSIEDAYNAVVRSPRLVAFMVPLLRVLHAAIRLRRGSLARALVAYLREAPPEAVVSLAPNFNAIIRDAAAEALPGVPFVVLLTDYADYPPHFWMEPGLRRVIVGSARGVEQAVSMGIPEEAITRTSGMPLHPRFYGTAEGARRRVRDELRIPRPAFVVLLLFGGKGSAEMEPLGRALLEESAEWHVVAICGDNPELVGRLGGLASGSAGRLHVLGFTDRVSEYMAAADLLVTKPGPGSLAEAFHQKLPVVLACNRTTIPQERFNAQWVRETGLGIVVRDGSEISAAAGRLARDKDAWSRIRRNVESLPPNRAVFEALDAITREVGLPPPPPVS